VDIEGKTPDLAEHREEPGQIEPDGGINPDIV
jgi:hypothetical protein